VKTLKIFDQLLRKWLSSPQPLGLQWYNLLGHAGIDNTM